jgi:hypothetical protein
MYVRGSDKNIEYKRDLNGFFRGIIMDDADFKKLYRCKIFIPELHTIPYTEVKGKQQYTAPDKIGSLPPDVHKALIDMLPWAEQASSLFGEQSTSHYSASREAQTGGVNYPQESSRTNPPNSKVMGTYPAQTLANASATSGPIADNNPLNPTGNIYAPAPNAPNAHGIHGTPSVGAHVWVFFDKGDINCPVYFAACPSGAETNQVMQEMNVNGYSSNYGKQEVEDTPPERKDTAGGPDPGGLTAPEDAIPFRSDGTFSREDLPPNLQPLYEDYVKYGEEYGVDPRFLASISILETGGGTSKAFREGNNAMGISNKVGVNYYRNDPEARGRSIRSMARSLAGAPGTSKFYGNATTINQIGPIYAPSGALNDSRGTNSGWARNVSNIMRRDFGVENPDALTVIDRT